jgi:hypothetical protein
MAEGEKLVSKGILRTLHDARDVLASGVFNGATYSPPLELALDLLKAANSGEPADVLAATEQIGAVPRFWKMTT